MKKSRTLWVLTIFFTWATLKSAGSIYGAESTSDYALLASIGIGFIYYVLSVLLLIGEAATAYLLFKQKAVGYIVGSWLTLAEALNGLLVIVITILNPDVAKAVYKASREARGLAVDQVRLDFLTSMPGIALMFSYFVLWGVVYYYLRRVKSELIVQNA